MLNYKKEVDLACPFKAKVALLFSRYVDDLEPSSDLMATPGIVENDTAASNCSRSNMSA